MTRRLLVALLFVFVAVSATDMEADQFNFFSKEELMDLANKFMQRFQMEEIGEVAQISKPEDGPKRPVVMMHGLGDAGSNPGMASLAKSVTQAYPGTYSIAVDVADGLGSFFTLISDQVDQFAATVRKDPKLAKGFNAVGLSQGGLVVRGYVAKYNNPPVYNLISICGPQDGVGTCPEGTPGFICDFFKMGPYTAQLSFAGYWKEVTNQAQYLKESTFLADINNERDTKNKQYNNNMVSLNKYVAIMALGDTVVQPKESAQHGFWKWNDTTHSKVETIFDTQAYNEDWMGLKTLVTLNKLDLLNFTGDHIRFSQQFWETVVLPYFDNTVEDSEAAADEEPLIPLTQPSGLVRPDVVYDDEVESHESDENELQGNQRPTRMPRGVLRPGRM